MLSTLTLIALLASPGGCAGDQHPLPEVARAAELMSQSPIDLPAYNWDKLGTGVRVKLSHEPFVPRIEDTGHGFKIPAPDRAKPSLKIEGVGDFKLVQLHYHIPSEHRLAKTAKGEPHRPVAEIHFVHASEDGKLAVIGVFVEVDEDADAPAFGGFDSLAEVLTRGTTQRTFSPLDVIPAGEFYSYRGSLTTSPYTEGLYWFVAKDVVKINRSQLELLKPAQLEDLAGAAGHARDPQPLNGRVITRSVQTR